MARAPFLHPRQSLIPIADDALGRLSDFRRVEAPVRHVKLIGESERTAAFSQFGY